MMARLLRRHLLLCRKVPGWENLLVEFNFLPGLNRVRPRGPGLANLRRVA